MKKNRLFTPGPTDVPPEVLNEMAKPIFHHRTARFREMLGKVHEGVQKMLFTSSTVLTITGSGTAGMEAAIVSACPRDKKVLVHNGGKFGERWAKIGRVYGLDVDEYKTEWGEAISAEVVKEKLATGEYGAVVVVYSETSTATACDLQAIAAEVKKTDAILLADCITAAGVLPLKMDEWGVDIVASGSQKAFMLPPGLATLAVSDKAWAKVDEIDAPAFYLNLKAYRKSIANNDTPYTPALTLIRGLQVAVDMINETGIETIWERSALIAKATRAAAEAIGLKVCSKSPSDSVTAIYLPEGIDDTFRKNLQAKYGLSVAGGQDDWKGRVIRISHMGYIDALETLGLFSAIENTLAEMGADIEVGKGTAVMAEILQEWK